ncbi:MAG: ribonuclease HII [Calditrichaeota bacterium]|nr:ribonuclease HII [Calditrichota bacterium]MCB9366420.1 ribonuclease HII [Calditrichota bacterium]
MELSFLVGDVSALCGCDESGRGPLAGPVVGAAVLFKDCEALWKCRDSKSLRPSERETLLKGIEDHLSSAFVAIGPEEIDQINIRAASLMAMTRAVELLNTQMDCVLVDGRDRLPGVLNCHAIVKGDARVATISAASVVAKVMRDRLMLEYHEQFPQYGFDRHFGYPTVAHRKALLEHGPCPIHRKSFRGVRELV